MYTTTQGRYNGHLWKAHTLLQTFCWKAHTLLQTFCWKAHTLLQTFCSSESRSLRYRCTLYFSIFGDRLAYHTSGYTERYHMSVLGSVMYPGYVNCQWDTVRVIGSR